MGTPELTDEEKASLMYRICGLASVVGSIEKSTNETQLRRIAQMIAADPFCLERHKRWLRRMWNSRMDEIKGVPMPDREFPPSSPDRTAPSKADPPPAVEGIKPIEEIHG